MNFVSFGHKITISTFRCVEGSGPLRKHWLFASLAFERNTITQMYGCFGIRKLEQHGVPPHLHIKALFKLTRFDRDNCFEVDIGNTTRTANTANMIKIVNVSDHRSLLSLSYWT